MKPVVFFTTLIPLVRTSAGMRPRAWFTRFWTSTAARSMLRPMSKVTLMVEKPLLVLEEVR